MQIKPGTKFNRLTYVRPVGRIPHGNSTLSTSEYLCDCGKTVVKADFYVKHGYSKSCGCLQREKAFQLCYKHGQSKSKLYGVWDGIITRCENEKHHDYKHYGAKGVRVCKEWRDDFTAFRDWALANGWKDGLTIDRISGGTSWYTPENCRVVDRKVQTENRAITVYVEYDGTMMTITSLAERLGLSYHQAYARYKSRLMVKNQDGTYEYRFSKNKYGKDYERSVEDGNVQKVSDDMEKGE